MLEFVGSGLYFVQDEKDFINPSLQVGFGAGFYEKRTGSGYYGSKIIGSLQKKGAKLWTWVQIISLL